MKILQRIKDRYNLLIFVTKIFTFMMKKLQNKNRVLKKKVKDQEEYIKIREFTTWRQDE